MRIDKVLVLSRFDIDFERKTIYGLSLGLLSAVDRVEIDQGNKYINVPITLFSRENWFEEFVQLAKES